MRSHLRTIAVLALAVGMVALFLREVDLRGVFAEIVRARPGWLLLSLASMYVNLAIRALRWRYLLEPLGKTSFGNAFRATTVGFAARGLLPAAAGELVRPYFLSRHEPVTATGAFATVVLERLLDMLTLLLLMASFVFVFGREQMSHANPVASAAVTWAGAMAALLAVAALIALFILAGHPARVNRALTRLEKMIPSAFAGLLARIADKFLEGLGAIRRPGRLLVALAWSLPLWLCIAFGIWAAAMAFRLPIPFTGSFLLMSLLAIGITVPTPGAVGGFHEAFRVGTTEFFGATQDAAVGAAIVLHAFSIGAALALGLLFAAQAGMNLGGMRALAREAESGRPA
jgi:glycosyltransferase 2 family protein